jgi:hypothetical protein
MSKQHPAIDDRLAAFMLAQPVFFVGTAPAGGDGHVNVSPKGLAGSFAVLGPREVAYLDLTGSGIETLAHLRENGRVVFMFCAFEGRPRILRLHGRGEALEPDDARWEELRARFPELPGARAIIRVDVQRIADSCGWGVPLMRFEGQRDQLVRVAEQLGAEKLAAGRAKFNRASLDGLPGLRSAGE